MSTLNLQDQGAPFSAVAAALSAHVSANKVLPKVLVLSKNQEFGVEGAIALAKDWLAEDAANDALGVIEILDLASCR